MTGTDRERWASAEPTMPPGATIAAVRLHGARGSIYEAFDSLGCGMGHEQAVEYINGSPHFQSLPEREQGKALGLALGFAIVAVEAERETRRWGRWFR